MLYKFARLFALVLIAHGAWAQTIAPSRVVVKPVTSTTFDQNVANIHWRKGNATNYIVLIRFNDVYSLYGSPEIIAPDDRPYATNGNGVMDANSLVAPNPYYGPVRSTTYLLKTGTYSSSADTTAQVVNTTIGQYYDVVVYEYSLLNGAKNYTHGLNGQFGAKASFSQPRVAPVITNLTVNGAYTPVITFTTAAENATSFFKVQWASDSTQLSSSLTSSFQVAPSNLPGASTYTVKLPLLAPGPLYYRVLLRAETRPLLAEDRPSKIMRYSPTGRYGALINNFRAGAAASAGAIDLKWTTSSEAYNGGFQLQVAPDSVSWQNLAFVNSKVIGISTTAVDYQYATPFSPGTYYRIQQVDPNGYVTATTHSLLVRATPLAATSATKSPAMGTGVYPNPAHDVVQVTSTTAGQPVELLNSLGQVVQTTTLAPGTASLAVQSLPRGVYILRQGNSSSRLVLE